jgi:hypothetical protein
LRSARRSISTIAPLGVVRAYLSSRRLFVLCFASLSGLGHVLPLPVVEAKWPAHEVI